MGWPDLHAQIVSIHTGAIRDAVSLDVRTATAAAVIPLQINNVSDVVWRSVDEIFEEFDADEPV